MGGVPRSAPRRPGARRHAVFFFFSSRRRHTRFDCDWSSDVCSSDLRDLAAQQQRQARDGFWFGAALGSGWARVSCQICQGNNRSGLSGTLRLGGGVSRKVLIGAEVAAWWATIETGADTVHQSLAAFGAAAYWYPKIGRAHV